MDPEKIGTGIGVATGYAVLTLSIITIDRFRANSPNRDDTQVELKILIYALMLSGVSIAANGADLLLAWIFSPFKGGADPIKAILPPLAVGAGTVAAMFFLFRPRTNAATARYPEILGLLTVGIFFGSATIISANSFIEGLFKNAPWELTSRALSSMLVDGALGFGALMTLGKAQGWVMPVRAAPPQYPQGGYPPGGGYPPPQGGGYPPPGGGYPPQGGGYPPQGGGYPPQGGGYPPQGGSGGYPPR
jgi:hypothetical protein